MKDSVLEAWFTRGGIHVDYLPEVSLAEVVIEQSAIQNIRLGLPLVEEHMLRYAIDMEQGADFPAIVIYRIGRGKFIGRYGVINGLHRIKAMTEFVRPARTSVDAYIVKSDDDVIIEMLQRTVNIATGGIPLMEEERIEHALRLIAMNYSITDAARLMSLKAGKLQRRKNYQDSIAKLKAAGIKTADIGVGMIDILRSVPRDKYFFQAVELSREARLSSEDMTELARALKAAPDDKAMDVILDDWRKRLVDRVARVHKGLTRGPAAPIYSLPAVLQKADRILRGPGNLATMTTTEIDNIIRLASKTITELRQLVETMKKIRRKAS